MKVSLIQLTVGPNVNFNFKKLQDLLNQSIKFNPDLILLPECCLFLSNKQKHYFSTNDSYVTYIKNYAKLNNIFILIGSLPIKENAQPYNQSILIDNTISNALKYSYEDCFVDIVIDFDDDKHKFFIEIIDDGMGIEKPNEVFNAYYQQKNENKGLGLGLNIVKEICDIYNIEIIVSSQENNTSFKYLFPKNLTKKEEE